MPDPVWWKQPSWYAAIGTASGVLVALFRDSLWAWWQRPKLEASIVVAPPDCVKTFFSDATGQKTVDCYYFRILVQNKGKRRAEDVEVYAERLFSRQNGEDRQITEFPPMDLLWSNVKRPLQGIAPGLQKHCDLGYIVRPGGSFREKASIEEKIAAILDSDVRFHFELEVKPNQLPWTVNAGVYRLDLAVAATNAKVCKLALQIDLQGKWIEDEQKMFTEGIKIQPIKPQAIRTRLKEWRRRKFYSRKPATRSPIR